MKPDCHSSERVKNAGKSVHPKGPWRHQRGHSTVGSTSKAKARTILKAFGGVTIEV
jgi:hypothetical protein